MGGKEEEPMPDLRSLPHVRSGCKYHVVSVPKIVLVFPNPMIEVLGFILQ